MSQTYNPNSTGLTATVDLNRFTYIFYYNAQNQMCFQKGTDIDGYTEYLVLTNQSDDTSTVTGRLDTLSATLWDGEEVQIYYVDEDNKIKALWWDDNKWNTGFINAKEYTASPTSAIYAQGFHELNPVVESDTRLKVFFRDYDNGDKLTEAFYKEGAWNKREIS
ncbi:MAG: hypothetical protein M1839_009280 [Geoglossum umbratile]|nr:MAG: hypothetical protein M1839_009280 [Geoglossum umbratile]